MSALDDFAERLEADRRASDDFAALVKAFAGYIMEKEGIQFAAAMWETRRLYQEVRNGSS